MRGSILLEDHTIALVACLYSIVVWNFYCSAESSAVYVCVCHWIIPVVMLLHCLALRFTAISKGGDMLGSPLKAMEWRLVRRRIATTRRYMQSTFQLS